MEDKYEFIDHTADILFKAQSDSLEGLFAQCGLAIGETTTNLVDIKPVISKEITGRHKKIDRLLFDFLDDLLFYKDSELLVFSKFELTIMEQAGEYVLKCRASGEALESDKHERKVDIKAITMHLFEVKKVEGGWQAQVLVDI